MLEKGKPIVVQVEKDPIGTKGAALTTSLSLAGRYLVLTPFEDTRGVSRKVEDEDTRKKLKGLANGLDLPDGCGVILRTNALGQTKITLNRDLSALLRLWKRVQTAAMQGKGTRLLYTDQDLILQALRDYLDSSIEEVLVDDDEAFEKAKAYIEAFMPRSKTRLVRYAERIPLFSRYDLETQIDRIYERRVDLPSGGSIVIDATEALTAIDVNSGRSTRAATQEETALNTNVEAAAEVARQLRLRDIGGLVVVDFIDMRAVEGAAQGREGPQGRHEGGQGALDGRPDLPQRPAGDQPPAHPAGAPAPHAPPLPHLQRRRPAGERGDGLPLAAAPHRGARGHRLDPGGPHRPPPGARRRPPEPLPPRARRHRDRVRHRDRGHRHRRPPPPGREDRVAEAGEAPSRRRSPSRPRSPSSPGTSPRSRTRTTRRTRISRRGRSRAGRAGARPAKVAREARPARAKRRRRRRGGRKRKKKAPRRERQRRSTSRPPRGSVRGAKPIWRRSWKAPNSSRRPRALSTTRRTTTRGRTISRRGPRPRAPKGSRASRGAAARSAGARRRRRRK